MASLTAWMDTLRSRVSGADDPTLELELKNTIREFSTQSGAFLKQLGPYAYQANKSDYDMNPQADGQVLWIHAVVGADDFPVQLVQAATAARRGLRYAIVPAPGVVRLNPVPSETTEKADGFTVWVGMTPFLTANTQVPDEFETHWFDHILDGTLGRLHSMHKRPWTNMVSAQYHLKRFRNGMAQARDVVRRRFSNAPSDFVFPPWGNLSAERDRW